MVGVYENPAGEREREAWLTSQRPKAPGAGRKVYRRVVTLDMTSRQAGDKLLAAIRSLRVPWGR
ncbi:MAG: hypothetical protein LJE74_10980 [Proteobacteria bacterium]|nr:hypothetical protein [Pseudomonadota bacterium]